ncbi:MAG: uracil-DNA glycosylase [Xanthomonadaceae bacterium]|nr:uracil-DNA glycosylase [Xanthomonadaceae bacterium]
MKNLNQEIISCNECPRLLSHCKTIAIEKRKSFAHDNYWGKPVTGFGDPHAELLIIGLAPAAHGANRTGRMFTGDRSGEWLYRALYEHGFANQPQSENVKDGLQLKNVYVTSIVKCAPPDNKPTTEERDQCLEYFKRELKELKHVKTYLVLGKFALDGLFAALGQSPKPSFKHGHKMILSDGKTLILSFHPSQQNTFTGKLTKPMFDRVFELAKDLL